MRTSDGSALVHLLLAGIVLAAEHGLKDEHSLEQAEKFHFTPEAQSGGKAYDVFPLLPSSCAESGFILQKKRALYERSGIFPPQVIDFMSELLQAENDQDLLEKLAKLPNKDRLHELRRILHRDLHRH
jgi:glutamine synthetase